MPKKVHLQIRCDEGLRDGLRAAARKDGLLVSEATRRAIRAYVDRPTPSVANEAIWAAIGALAAFSLSPAAIDMFIASLKAYDAVEQMAGQPASSGISAVVKTLEESNMDA
jgi:hypothetical protein